MSPRSQNYVSPSRIDAEWCHQIALPDEICTEDNFLMIRRFFEERGLDHHVRYVQAIWPNRRYQQYRLHCFRDLPAAELFRTVFGGEVFDPQKDREGGKVKGAWRRSGTWFRLLESGPLKVPKILRD